MFHPMCCSSLERQKQVTIFSTLTEGEVEDLAKGFGKALAKHVPKDKLLSGIPEEDIPATM